MYGCTKRKDHVKPISYFRSLFEAVIQMYAKGEII